jgi:pyridoxal phosphate enzyme (YggS family)
MSDIASNIISLKKEIPPSVKLIAVSKTKPVDDIMEAYSTGHRIFGENRVQELLSKKDLLPGDIEWHLIGHLQSNKVRYVVPFINMIHSVDSSKLLVIIDDEARKINRVVRCLLQFHIAVEETKFGFDQDEVNEMLGSEACNDLAHVKICGVMGIASFTGDETRIRDEFRQLSACFKLLKNRYFMNAEYFTEISMGMSGDFRIAIEEGSTIIRIGSIIFGERK